MENLKINGQNSVATSAQKIFNHTKEELIDMFTPLSEYEKKVSKTAENKCGFGTIVITTKYRLHRAEIIQNKIENLCSSEEEFEEIIDTIDLLIIDAYKSGVLAEQQENGTFDECVEQTVEEMILEHIARKQEA